MFRCPGLGSHTHTPTHMGSFLKWGPFWGPFYEGAILYWGPERGPYCRELPTCTRGGHCILILMTILGSCQGRNVRVAKSKLGLGCRAYGLGVWIWVLFRTWGFDSSLLSGWETQSGTPQTAHSRVS